MKTVSRIGWKKEDKDKNAPFVELISIKIRSLIPLTRLL
jgi:hypothetical protein